MSEEGVTGLPQGQPGAGVGRTQKTFLPTGLFPEFDFSVEVLPNFNSTKKEESISHRPISKPQLQKVYSAGTQSVRPEPAPPSPPPPPMPRPAHLEYGGHLPLGQTPAPVPKLQCRPSCKTLTANVFTVFVQLHKNRSFYIYIYSYRYMYVCMSVCTHVCITGYMLAS